MKKIKVSEATGRTLDWLVELTERAVRGEAVDTLENGDIVLLGFIGRYSDDWAKGGPIIEREFMDLETLPCGIDSRNGTFATWRAWTHYESQDSFEASGQTALIAAMRCFVVSRLGEEVEVPDDLT